MLPIAKPSNWKQLAADWSASPCTLLWSVRNTYNMLSYLYNLKESGYLYGQREGSKEELNLQTSVVQPLSSKPVMIFYTML